MRTKNGASGKFELRCYGKIDDQSKLTMAVMVNVARADTIQLEVAMHMMMKAKNRDKKIPWKASWMILLCSVIVKTLPGGRGVMHCLRWPIGHMPDRRVTCSILHHLHKRQNYRAISMASSCKGWWRPRLFGQVARDDKPDRMAGARCSRGKAVRQPFSGS